MDPQIVTVAEALRVQCILLAQSSKVGQLWADEYDLAGACSTASIALTRLLRRRQVPVQMVMGGYGMWDDAHCWVHLTAEDTILDVTATQFRELADVPVAVLPPQHPVRAKYRPRLRGRAAVSEVIDQWTWDRATRKQEERRIRLLVDRTERLLCRST